MQDALQKFFASFDHVYCLSLPRCNERRYHVQQLFKASKVTNFSFVDAIDSNSDDVTFVYENRQVLQFPLCFRCNKLTCGDPDCNNTLVPPQVATFLSYLKLWRQFVDSGHQTVLVVEDDIKFVSEIEQRCERLGSTQWQEQSGLFQQQPALLQLGWAYCDEHDLMIDTTVTGFMGKMSNPAFAINKGMATLLLSNFNQIDTTVDIYIHRRIANKSNAKTVFPPLFYEMSWSTGEVESTIHPKQIRVDYLSSNNGNAVDIEEASARLLKHQKHTKVYPIAVLGHPRCGSGYASELLCALGVEVGHEAMQRDGISSWMFAVDDDSPWAFNAEARTRKFKYFKHVIHHVRDPRAAVASIIRDNIHAPKSYEYRKKHILQSLNVDLDSFESNFTRAVASYVYWNELIMLQQPSLRFRIEDDVEKLKTYLANTGDFQLLNEPVYPKNNVNSDKLYQGKCIEKPQISVDEFLSLPESMLTKLNNLCRQFGYAEFVPLNTFDKSKYIDQLERLTLQPTGWLRSAEENASVAEDGMPLPWWTIPGTEFIKSVLSSHWRVFEYGCGNSTLWWARYVSQVNGVDHDGQWVDKVRPCLQEPNEIRLSEFGDKPGETAIEKSRPYFNRRRRLEFGYDDEKMTRRGLNDKDFIAYADTINKVGGKFDCIVIDGMARRLCTEFAVSRLNENGIIIFDNSNRSDYLEGYQFLVENGFYQLRFSGPVVGATFPSCTSVFLKDLKALPKIVFEPSMFNIQEF